MYQNTPGPRYTPRKESAPTWGAILVTGLAALMIPLMITVITSYPSLGLGILVGLILSTAVRKTGNIARRLVRYDPEDVYRASSLMRRA